ncbi:energy-coupling factor transporter transmembrane component T family protein [Glaciibacter flavus]|uniref:energy-coupling factor transporter transmembrane component T family protein n=1 Tax=Orlajensenia flava TaxID=2565934 RepID=UPI003B008BF0
MIAFYSPGRSSLHRAPAVLKLLLLAASVTVVALLGEPWQLALAAGITVFLFVVATVPARLALRGIAPVLWLLLVALPLNAWFSGWESAAVMAGRVITAVALAALFTLTTSVTAVLGAMTALLRPFPRIDADRIGLMLALTIRSVPLLTTIVGSVVEARKARGLERSLRAIAVPVIVRALQTADELGEALIARGLDD